MQQWEALKEKTNEELFSLYQEDRRTEIKQELTLRYLYIVKAIAVQTYNIYSGFMQMEDIINEGVIAIMKGIDDAKWQKHLEDVQKYDITRYVEIKQAFYDRMMELLGG